MTFYKGQKMNRKPRKRHPSTKERVRTTREQRKALLAMRKLLAEQGYQIFPVATWFRRTAHDFVAAPRDNPNYLLVVRPTTHNVAEIRYYAFRGFYERIKTLLDAHVKQCGRMKWGAQLPAGRTNKGQAWRQYISRNCLLELELFADL